MIPGRGTFFGISVTPYADDYPQIVEQVLAAERLGLDAVGIQDHPYQRRFLDTYSLIADLLARTDRLTFFPDVTSLPMRPPAMIAKAAASLDVMSGGRFELGLGAGNFWDAVAGMGGTVRPAGERLASLEEAVRIIRDALDAGGERRLVSSDGPHYPAHRYPAGPPPAQRVEIWLGAMAPGTLRLIGRSCDGWIAGAGISRAAEFGDIKMRLDDAAAAAGRDPGAIRRIVNLMGTEIDDPPAWVDLLTGLHHEHGISGFVFWAPDAGTDQIERFANEVVPAVRSRLGA